jgi:hypothetical protein
MGHGFITDRFNGHAERLSAHEYLTRTFGVFPETGRVK